MSAALRQRRPQPERNSPQWCQRARELYQARTHLFGWRRLGQSNRGFEFFAVYSGDTSAAHPVATKEHTVRWVEATGEAICDCQAGHFHGPCWHAGQVLGIKERDAWAQSRQGAEQARRDQAGSEWLAERYETQGW